jgi:GDP-mannose transporter
MAEKEKQDDFRVEIGDDKRPYTPAPAVPVSSSPTMAILSYCGASILMTLTNKYVLSGYDFNLNFMLLAIQVCNLTA